MAFSDASFIRRTLPSLLREYFARKDIVVVAYRIQDVEAFEAEQLRQVTPRAQRVGSGGTRGNKDA